MSTVKIGKWMLSALVLCSTHN